MKDTAPTWEVWLSTPQGKRDTPLIPLTFSLVKTVNEVGAFSATLPGDFDRNLLRVDSIIEFWRTPPNMTPRLELAGFLRSVIIEDDEEGLTTITIGGPDGNDLIQRRIVAYFAGAATTAKNDQADDMMKAIVRENLGSSATDTARDLSGYGLTVDADRSAGPSIVKGFAWREVLPLFKDIADAAREKGTPVYFQMEPYQYTSDRLSFAFRTYTGQVGSDRSVSGASANPVIFSKDFSNLERPRLELDYKGEENHIYSAGQNTGSDRTLVEVSDSTRINASIWNRREGFIDSRNSSDTEVSDRAYGELSKGRPLLRFSGDLLDTKYFRYSRDWNYGDKVTVYYKGYEFHQMVKSVRFDVDSDGIEKLAGKLEYEA